MFGGASKWEQVQALKECPEILVATPVSSFGHYGTHWYSLCTYVVTYVHCALEISSVPNLPATISIRMYVSGVAICQSRALLISTWDDMYVCTESAIFKWLL